MSTEDGWVISSLGPVESVTEIGTSRAVVSPVVIPYSSRVELACCMSSFFVFLQMSSWSVEQSMDAFLSAARLPPVNSQESN